jgi:hypothetical protein
MTIPVACPHCKRRLNVPEKYAGRRVTCNGCLQPVRVASPEEPARKALVPMSSRSASASEPADTTALSTRLGIGALALGLVGIMVLCVPVFGYVSLGLSGVGLILSVSGLACAHKERGLRISSPAAAGFQPPNLPARRELTYPLAGIGVCLLAATLALLPFALH